MIQLTKNMIRNLATNEKTFMRGVQYFQNGRIQNASYSKSGKRYKITVKGKQIYMVTIEEQEDGSFLSNCNCPNSIKEKGACKHTVAALLMLLKHQERSEGNLPKNAEEKRAYQVLEYFDNQETVTMTGEVFHIEPVITLPSMLRNNAGKAYISLRAGSNKIYKVQNIKKFLEDYIRRENILLGKEFRYIAGESAFDRSSKAIIDFLLEIYDVTELADGKDAGQIFLKSQMVLSKFLFIKFLRQFAGTPFSLELYGNSYEEVRCIPKNPNIEIELLADEDFISLDYKDREPVIPVSENGEILYRDRFLFLPDKQFLRNFLPFFNSLGGDKKPLVFQGVYKQRFLQNVLPRLHGTMDILVPEELKERYISPDLNIELFFDKYQNYVKVELFFKYDEYRFNSFENLNSGDYIILRQREKEMAVINLLEEYGFEPYSGFYLLKADNEIYQFLQEGINILMEHGEVFYSEAFRKMKAKQTNAFSVGLRVSKDIDLLEMDLNYGDISKEELQQLFRSYRLKKKFFRLTDGSFIDLESEEIGKMVEILDNLNVSAKEMEGQSTFKLSKGLALYLDDLFDETAIEVQKNEEFRQMLDTVSDMEQQTYEIPSGVRAELRPYQELGFRWLMTLSDHQLGGILADDMGLGKTLQAIVYMKAMKERDEQNQFLIVCPTSLVYNWMDELENFTPDLRCRVITGTPEERSVLIKDSSEIDVIITSYPLLRRDIANYEEKKFHTVFLDEAQFIKNAASLNAKSVKALQAFHRFALTGTPIENSLSELWSIFDFVMPYYLLTHSRFVKQYEKQILKNDEAALNSLNKRIRPFILRRMKKDVLHDLPEKVETKFLTDLTMEQKKIYLSFLESFRGELGDDFSAETINRSRVQILAALTRLRQICCHPGTFLDNYEGESGKLDLFLQILPDLVSNGHRILVFSQFTSMLDIIQKSLKELGYEYFYMEGNTKVSERNDYVKRFNAGEGQLFLISLKAGGTGLNLVGADTVIHFDPWWNPAVEDQATDRAHRIGQKNSVQVIKLITKGTIEEKIFKLQKKKKELSDSVIEAKEVFINSLSKEELEELFSFEA
ncbi:MAG: SNF2 helicase associated domain-containing protein [Lachnospiraceae bacterium]|nr:SNF2 helicase associated domain-containing protein [Lachnospiraceae bacterium]